MWIFRSVEYVAHDKNEPEADSNDFRSVLTVLREHSIGHECFVSDEEKTSRGKHELKTS